MGASEQFRAEVYYDLGRLFKEKEHFLRCQGCVGPFGGSGSTVMAFMFVFLFGRRVRPFIRGFLGLDWPYSPFTRSGHMYFIVVYVFRSIAMFFYL